VFHAVTSEVLARDLRRRGLEIDLVRLEIGALGDEVWEGVARSYWGLENYLCPIARWPELAAAAAAAGPG